MPSLLLHRWSIPSPPPFYNFAKVPEVDCIDPFWDEKQKGTVATHDGDYEEIHMPRNSPMGAYLGTFALAISFAIIWHIWWLAIVSIVAIFACIIIRLFDQNTDYYVTVAEVKEIEAEISKRKKGLEQS